MGRRINSFNNLNHLLVLTVEQTICVYFILFCATTSSTKDPLKIQYGMDSPGSYIKKSNRVKTTSFCPNFGFFGCMYSFGLARPNWNRIFSSFQTCICFDCRDFALRSFRETAISRFRHYIQFLTLRRDRIYFIHLFYSLGIIVWEPGE